MASPPKSPVGEATEVPISADVSAPKVSVDEEQCPVSQSGDYDDAEDTLEDDMGSADKCIRDVVSSVEAEYAAEPGEVGHMEDTDIGSLELSEKQSQPVDGMEPVTQVEDVSTQLEAEEARKEEKIKAARERRNNSLEEKEPDLSVPIDGTVPISPVAHAKARVAVCKQKKPEVAPTRRSPRVAANSSPGAKRQSPRVSDVRQMSASPAKASPVQKGTKAKQPSPKMKQPAATVKESAAKGKKGPAKGKHQAVVKGKKTDCNVKKAPRTTKKSVHFEKDQDYVADDVSDDEDDHDVEDVVSDEFSDDEADLGNYEFVQRSAKRKRGETTPSSSVAGSVKKSRFNTTARCSLKDISLCIKLLKDRHMHVLQDSGLGHLKDFKIKSNINRRLGAFLMYRVDPTTMTLDLGDGNKVLQITADVIFKLFGLPRGNNSPPRPSDEHVDALRKLKDELDIPRNKDIKTDDLRKILLRLVDDPANDDLAMKVFGLILFNKFICPGYSLRVKREATMVEDFDFVKLKDM